MFNLKDFESNSLLEPIVNKLNKAISKSKDTKVIKIIEELEEYLDQPEHVVPVTYILSILAEQYIDLIPERFYQKLREYLKSDNEKLRINSITIIGFVLLAKPNLTARFFHEMAQLLIDKSEDVRDNVHYFLSELVNDNANLVEDIKDIILISLSSENKKENILSLFKLLQNCESLSFDQLYQLREISKLLITSYFDDEKTEIIIKLLDLLATFFPLLDKTELKSMKFNDLEKILDKQFIMKKYNFTKISKKSDINLKAYLNKKMKSNLKEKKVNFYTKTKKNIIYIYELEKSKLISIFEEGTKISQEKIYAEFSQIIQNESELKTFIQTLINLKIINGYYSDLGFFYPNIHIKSRFLSDLSQNGLINLKKYNYLPPDFIGTIIKDIKNSQNDKLLLGKNNKYFSLKQIQEQINREAAKNSVIDLKSYREKLTEEDFINLVKNLPKEYLSKFHKGTQWITNLGALRISNEVQSSKIVGYFDIARISKNLNIGEILLLDLFDHFVDYRSGIWDKPKEVFYYSKYLNIEIEKLNLIANEQEKSEKIDLLAKKLNIDKNLIVTKIDENLQLIAREIKEKDQIKISEYIEKTGMDLPTFMKFIDDLNINYFKKEDLLIFNIIKIQEAKNDIKLVLANQSKSSNTILLGNFDITSNLILELINDLLIDGKLKGIFHEEEGEIVFYTERGIRNLMLENSFMFSFNDLFYGKELNEDELGLLRELFDDLVKSRKLKGTFNEENLSFSSDEVLFAKDYNTVLFEFEKKVNSYIKLFELEFQRIKKILTKREETIFPQEIKLIQETIDKINGRYVGWRNNLESFIHNTNKKFLRDQGISVKKYKELFPSRKKEDIKSFEEDPEVHEHLNNFLTWIKLFNKLEIKYQNIIFYQKRLINNPDDKESNIKLNELLNELFLD
ncbi:MAG: hypothetical protein ACXAEX_06960 [Promethearchaeota archaeon]|jgi:hypothetical protein